MGGCKRVFKGIWGTTVVRGGGYIQVSCCNSLDELLGDSVGDGGAWKNGTEKRSSWKRGVYCELFLVLNFLV